MAVNLGGNVRIIDVTVTTTSGTSYATGDFVGVDATALVFTGAADGVGQGGVVLGAVLEDDGVNSVAGELWLFDTAVTPPADSAAWSITDAHAQRLICVIPFAAADYYASALNTVCGGIPKGPSAFKCLTGSTSIYGCFVTRGAPSSPVYHIRLTILQN